MILCRVVLGRALLALGGAHDGGGTSSFRFGPRRCYEFLFLFFFFPLSFPFVAGALLFLTYKGEKKRGRRNGREWGAYAHARGGRGRERADAERGDHPTFGQKRASAAARRISRRPIFAPFFFRSFRVACVSGPHGAFLA
jgi:hypothetical protein